MELDFSIWIRLRYKQNSIVFDVKADIPRIQLQQFKNITAQFHIKKTIKFHGTTSKTIIQVQASWVFVGPAETIEKISKNFCTIRSFVRSLVRSKIFQILVRADAIDLVQKSSNFEPSSRFFGRLKILNSKRRRNEAFEFDSSCRAPQRALQLELHQNAKV